MRVLFIGDVHGSDKWIEPVNYALLHFVDKIVFVGDYLDSFNIKPVVILDNFKKIIGLKKKYPDKIILLIGNHDYAYYNNFRAISGFNHQMYESYYRLLRDNWSLFDIAWGYPIDKASDFCQKYTLVTHAGLSKNFYERYILDETQSITSVSKRPSKMNQIFSDKYLDCLQIHEILNYFKDESETMWKVGSERGGNGCGSILWADKNEILQDRFRGINQIIGHTGCKYISQYKKDGDDLYFIDINNYDKQVGTLMLEL